MDINNLTLSDMQEIAKKLGEMNITLSVRNEDLQPFEIGSAYLIRTVTHIDIGIVVAVGEKEIILTNASWIADTGRFHDALTKGPSILNEVEPYPEGENVIVGRGAIADACRWLHDLPLTQK